MNKGLMSFCCLSYNHANYIEECIKSIWEQDYKNIEIIALDDGSTDESVTILKKLKEISPCPITVISQDNSGCIGENFNKLIQLAKGEYITFIACDDNYIKNTIKKKVNYLLKDINLAFICDSKIHCINDKGESINDYTKMPLDKMIFPKSKDLLKLDYEDIHSYYVQGAIYRKEIIDAIGGFDDDMICDDLILRTKVSRYLLEHPNLKFKVLHKESVNYRRHSANISSNSLRQVKGVIQYIKKYHKKPPEKLLIWIDDCINSNNAYKTEIIKWINELNVMEDYNEFFKNGICYKKRGIPFIFEILTYRKKQEKIKIIKLFNVKIMSYVKNKTQNTK